MTSENLYNVGILAQRLANGYYAHIAAMHVASDARAELLIPESMPGTSVSLGFVSRKDGTQHAFDFRHYLRLATSDPEITSELPKIWLAGALLTLGDCLAIHHYFDRSPILEFVRHLRNGIAHGNRFRIDNPKSLINYPAHTKDALIKGDSGHTFEILPNLNGQEVLFNYLAPANVLDAILSVGLYLIRKSGK